MIVRSEIRFRGSWTNRKRMSERNLFKINKDECRGLHSRRNNTWHCYMLWPDWLKNSPAEKGLRVLVNNKLTMRQWCKRMARAANSLLGHIRKGIESMWRDVVFCLCLALIKPHMEHCVQLRVPQYKKEKDLLDQVQWRTTKMTRGLEHLPYEESLKELRLLSLEKRASGGCLTHVFKYLMGCNKECSARLFPVVLRDKRQWAQGKNCEILSEHKKTLFYCEAGQTHCPQRLRHSVNNWAWSWAKSSSWPCVSKGLGLDGFMKCFPTETILLFWDWVVVYDYLMWGYRED